VIALATISSVKAAVGLLLWIPLGLIGALLVCVLVVALGVATGAAGLWAIRRAADTVLGPAQDLI
jgi:hypothetical protein